MKNIFEKLKFHLLALALFILTGAIYCYPALSGKVIGANDLLLGQVLEKSTKPYADKTGEFVHWTNALFSGMPASYGSSLSNYFYQIPFVFGKLFLGGFFSFDTLVWIMLGAYLLLLSVDVKKWMAVTGAIVMGLATFNIISLEGGHVLKVIGFGCLPGVLAGLIFLTRKEYTKGIIITLIYMNVTLSLNHTQISYYMIMMIILFCVAAGIKLLMENELQHVIKVAAIVAGITAVSALSNYNLINNVISAKETIRSGVSELTDGKTAAKEGLDPDYATAWSNGKLETFSALIPDMMGGNSSNNLIYDEANQALDENSATLKAIQSNPEGKNYQNGVSVYWGEQSFVSGGNYMGVILVFLMVLSFFTIKDKTKYALILVGVFFLLLSFGKNLTAFTNIAFNYFPMYNRFRSPSMCISVVQMIVGIMGLWGLKEFIESKESGAQKMKTLYITAGIVGGILVIFYLFGTSIFPFASDMELLGDLKRQIKPMPKWLLSAVTEDRASIMKADILRSLLYVAIGFGLLWAYTKEMINAKVLVPVLGIIMIVDLWMVDNRSLNTDDFTDKKEIEANSANTAIMSDPGDYRVFNLYSDPNQGGPNPFNDAPSSAFHQSIGGYHPAKLRRYQELIENQIGKNNTAVWDMLNTKYLIGGDGKSGPQPQQNPNACGSAWFVPEFKLVANGLAEMHSMDNPQGAMPVWNPRQTAILWTKYAKPLVDGAKIQFDSSASIKLVSKDNHHVKYEVNTKTQQLAIFSEIYYIQEDGDGFKAFVDGKETPIMKANYVLRALVIPAGAKEVSFVYDSAQFDKRNTISFAFSLIPVFVILFLLYKKKDELMAPMVEEKVVSTAKEVKHNPATKEGKKK